MQSGNYPCLPRSTVRSSLSNSPIMILRAQCVCACVHRLTCMYVLACTYVCTGACASAVVFASAHV